MVYPLLTEQERISRGLRNLILCFTERISPLVTHYIVAIADDVELLFGSTVVSFAAKMIKAQEDNAEFVFADV